MIALLETLTAIADEIACHYFEAFHFGRGTLDIDIKSDTSPVTQADLEIESKIRMYLNTHHPHMDVIGEEFGGRIDSQRTQLIIDPIDGTKNFIAGIPFFGSLMAIVEEGMLTHAMVSMPIYRQRWQASKGKGSLYNHHPIHVSSVTNLEDAMAFHSSFAGEKKPPASLLPLLKRTKRQRGYGDFYAHMMVAMGCGEFAYDCGLKLWDIAPLKLIVEEAGGRVTDQWGMDSYESGTVLSSNGQFHHKLVNSL